MGSWREHLPVALLGVAEPHLVLVEDAEVDPGRERDGRPLGAPPVVIDGHVVVAVDVVDISQLEQDAVVFLVEAEGLLELGRGLGHLAVGGEQASLLEVVFGRRAAVLLLAGEDLLRLGHVPGLAERAGAMQLGVLGVVAQLVRLGERRGRLLVLLLILQGQAAEEVGHADLPGLLEVLLARVVPAQQDLAHAQPQVGLGLGLLLLPLALPDIGHGLAQRPISGRIAVEQLAQVGHGGDVEWGAVHDRTDVSGHHFGHAYVSPSHLSGRRATGPRSLARPEPAAQTRRFRHRRSPGRRPAASVDELSMLPQTS